MGACPTPTLALVGASDLSLVAACLFSPSHLFAVLVLPSGFPCHGSGSGHSSHSCRLQEMSAYTRVFGQRVAVHGVKSQ